MSKKKVTLAVVKAELANDVIFNSAPAPLQRSAILLALEEIDKAPHLYSITEKSRKAIIAYADSLVKS